MVARCKLELTSVEDTEEASRRIDLRSARLRNVRVEIRYSYNPVFLALCMLRAGGMAQRTKDKVANRVSISLGCHKVLYFVVTTVRVVGD